MLEIENYKKRYGRKTILTISKFIVEQGIFWIQGENGVGKSTLLKSIAGIISFEGSISYKGLDCRKSIIPYRQLINFGDAEPLYPEFLTGRELIRLYEQAKNADPKYSSKRIADLQMDHYLDSMVSTYSTGMLKKLSLLLAFVGHPKMILLDEPFITIDAETLNVIYHWISEAWNHHEVSFILSSHQLIANDVLPSIRRITMANKNIDYC